MKRREFVAAAGALGLLPMAGAASANQAAERAILELRTYQLDTPQQREGFETFCREAAIPALNRLGIGPVGVGASELPDAARELLNRAGK